jgi:hypothetical protein
VQFPDVPLKLLRYAALIHEGGGVGYYPTSATPFVHVDTSRVRAWPRLPRYELALLFPFARTQHLPATGGPLTLGDVREARARYPDLAQQVADFQTLRTTPHPVMVAAVSPPVAKPKVPPATTVAALTPPAKLVVEPRLVDRPTPLSNRSNEMDAQKLTQLATLAALPELIAPPRLATRPKAPDLGAESGAAGAVRGAMSGPDTKAEGSFVTPALLASIGAALANITTTAAWETAPEFDDDHPDEVSYRPFPIAPFLTETASFDDPALVNLVHPDVARTLDLLDADNIALPMTLRPGPQVAQLLWAQRFESRAITAAERSSDAPAQLANRAVRTEIEH